MNKYSRVSYELRCQISALLQAKFTIPEIAESLGFHKSTIYRELKRNTTLYDRLQGRPYDPVRAHKLCRRRFRRCRKKTKVVGRVKRIVKSGLRERWSPELIAGRIRLEKIDTISHETVYRFVRHNPQFAKYLKFYGRRGYGRYRQKKERPGWMLNIKLRPDIANRRGRIGDWERDTMYAKYRKTILVLTERKSRYTKLSKLKTHKASEVAKKTYELLKATGKRVYTITNDNGGEFRWKHKEKYKVFYCDPYKPQQRGTVENMIGVLRRYVKRDTDLRTIDIKRLEERINLRPRKILDYLTPFEVFYGKKVALAL